MRFKRKHLNCFQLHSSPLISVYESYHLNSPTMITNGCKDVLIITLNPDAHLFLLLWGSHSNHDLLHTSVCIEHSQQQCNFLIDLPTRKPAQLLFLLLYFIFLSSFCELNTQKGKKKRKKEFFMRGDYYLAHKMLKLWQRQHRKFDEQTENKSQTNHRREKTLKKLCSAFSWLTLLRLLLLSRTFGEYMCVHAFYFHYEQTMNIPWAVVPISISMLHSQFAVVDIKHLLVSFIRIVWQLKSVKEARFSF